MKKLLIASVLLLGIGISGFAQTSQVRVIALLNKASWCPVCQVNGARFTKDIMPMVMTNKQIKIVKNDLLDDKTKGVPMKMLEKAGIADFAKDNTATGMLYFLDDKTKKLISKVSIAAPDGKIRQVFKEVLMKG